jgi:hypothetical protein
MSLPKRRRKPAPEPAAAHHPRPAPDPFAPLDAQEIVNAPGPWLMMLEARAPWEAMALAAVSPWLSRMPSGDGHAVLVFPGLGANDMSTLALRPS